MIAYCSACGVPMKKVGSPDKDGDQVWYCWKCDTERTTTKEERWKGKKGD